MADLSQLWNHSQALAWAVDVVNWLSPFCDRIEIAGSLRRQKRVVKDIEIVCVSSQVRQGQQSLFEADGGAFVDAIESGVTELVADVRHPLQRAADRKTWDPAAQAWKTRTAADGPRYKRLSRPAVRGRQIEIDLFIATAETWGNLLALRTGPAEFSKRLVTARALGGCLPQGYRHEGGAVVGPDGLAVPLFEERDYFALLRLPMWAPVWRDDCRLRDWLAERWPEFHRGRRR